MRDDEATIWHRAQLWCHLPRLPTGSRVVSAVIAVAVCVLHVGVLDQGPHQHRQRVILLHPSARLADLLQHIWKQDRQLSPGARRGRDCLP